MLHIYFLTQAGILSGAIFRLQKQARMHQILHFQIQKNAKSFIIVFPIYMCLTHVKAGIFTSLLVYLSHSEALYSEIYNSFGIHCKMKYQIFMLKREKSNLKIAVGLHIISIFLN